ncbi:NAD(P)-binding protein [Lophium mytilinum]|uniref:NAD(P)-binding protein n=1 Tax=Lophium mytilinum TaxID=390894 RepID=A0A6A6RA23_9PEZI|nr:NAD(P)-binding protein [Lophium mytilinum]
MPTILITGAASGIGLAFLKHYLSLPAPPRIIAVDHHEIPPQEEAQYSPHTLDVSSEASLQDLSSRLKNTPIDLLIHSVGIRGLVPSAVAAHPGDVPATESIDAMDAATMIRTFETNTLGTFLVIRALLPSLRLAASPRVVVMGSRMGSLSYNTTGGGYAYRASKAALNAVVKSFSVDVPDVWFLLVHPGRVESGLVDWKEEGAISAEESVGDMMKLLEKEEMESGRFVDRWGVDIGW